jgi:DNA-binding response OmpR family regulator
LDGESGVDLKRQLSNSVPALPVIFITGRDSEANRYAVQQVGGAAYLTKPFGVKALLKAIETEPAQDHSLWPAAHRNKDS